MRKTRDLFAVLFVGLFLLTHSLVFIWLLVGAIILFHPENSYGKFTKNKKPLKEAEKAARHYGLQIPKESSIQQMLQQVYARLDQSIKLYPHLRTQYEDVIDDFWKSLVINPSHDQWRYLLTTLLAEWPVEKQQVQNTLKEKLTELRKTTQQWDSAKQEAYGEN